MNASLPPSTPQTLRQALARASADLNRQSPSPRVPDAVMSAMARPAATGHKHPRLRRFVWAGGALAALTLTLGEALLFMAPPAAMPPVQQELSTAFMPVGNTEHWSQLMTDAREPGHAWVVPTELPSESLAAMGLPYDPASAGQTVRAELLVHASGDVLAVRFVR
ncbi:hypothetical protein [Piscinibacter terrae]|uniref:Uncharacterized protein n=1 Tax=Piscinibacter terrae TaxID=2496871 RepID=A0A3N7JTC5_9BURK|nr:hypothetical protein [Albitalea terrae]RQP24199.1 hypothetical protein DZC73_12840 [Albitalea terrae]